MRHFTIRLVARIALLAMVLGWALDKTEAQRHTLGPLLCPEGTNICTWDGGRRWRQIWKAEFGTPVLRFTRVPDGRVVVHARGHNHPGSLYVLDQTGEVQLTKRIGYDVTLEQVAGVTAIGDVVLCHTEESAYPCSWWLPANLRDTGSRMDFPRTCYFPRFFDDGRGLCADSESLWIQSKPDGVFNRRAIAWKAIDIDDIEVCDDTVFVLENRTVHVLQEQGSQELGVEGVVRLWCESDHLFIGREEYDGTTEEFKYELLAMPQPFVTEVLWSSESQMVADIVPDDGGFVIDTWDGEDRELYRIDAENRRAKRIGP